MTSIIFVNCIILLTILFLITWAFIAFIVYFIPFVIAYIRRHENLWIIGLLNLTVGWTFLGWLASLLWALNSDIKEIENDND